MARQARGRGSIEVLPSGAVRVAVYTGIDRSTGRRRYLREVVPAGPDRDAQAEEVRRRLVAQVEGRREDRSSRSVNELLDRHFELADLEEATRSTYEGYAERHIRPVLGRMAVSEVGPQVVDEFYGELRRCRDRCAEPDSSHVCRPISPSGIRQVHFILRGAFKRALRWGWVRANPIALADPPAAPKPHPQPPTPAEAGRILQQVWSDPDWAMLIWLAMVTGMRRGELCALRWRDLDTDAGVVTVGRSIGQRVTRTWEKDTKTHQHRRIALDHETLVLLAEHRRRSQARAAQEGEELALGAFVFSRSPDSSTHLVPDSVSQRYRRETSVIGIDTTLHKLRHYTATELIASGVDVRTVAGRLGHASGVTTLRTYAAWVSEADQKAADALGDHMPAPPEPVSECGPPGNWSPTSPYEKVADLVSRDIALGRYPVGTQLPTFATIGAQQQLSVATVQRAITLLASWNVVEVGPGRRARVVGLPRV